MRDTLYGLIARNKFKTFFFIVIFSLVLAVVGAAVVTVFNWGIAGYAFFGIFIVLYNIVLYYNSDKLALLSVGAKPAAPEEFSQLNNVVEEVAIAGGVPKPKVYIIEDMAPNAFATGRDPRHASVAVTRGLLEILNRDQLQGVVAHEVSHIKNYDMLLMTIVGILGGLVILFRDFFFRFGLFFGGGRRSDRRGGGSLTAILIIVGLVLAILAPIVVLLIRSAISRQREYLADASGAFLTRNPEGLASALERLETATGKLKGASQAIAHLFIANPFGKDRIKKTAGLFSTHPPLADRIQRLRSLTI
jgi:heat shock protein HtpX